MNKQRRDILKMVVAAAGGAAFSPVLLGNTFAKNEDSVSFIS